MEYENHLQASHTEMEGIVPACLNTFYKMIAWVSDDAWAAEHMPVTVFSSSLSVCCYLLLFGEGIFA